MDKPFNSPVAEYVAAIRTLQYYSLQPQLHHVFGQCNDIQFNDTVLFHFVILNSKTTSSEVLGARLTVSCIVID